LNQFINDAVVGITASDMHIGDALDEIGVKGILHGMLVLSV